MKHKYKNADRVETLKVYMDFDQTRPFDSTYEVEFFGDKGRVSPVYSFRPTQSRLNKLSCVGKTGDNYHYSLTVLGRKIYFKSTYKLE